MWRFEDVATFEASQSEAPSCKLGKRKLVRPEEREPGMISCSALLVRVNGLGPGGGDSSAVCAASSRVCQVSAD